MTNLSGGDKIEIGCTQLQKLCVCVCVQSYAVCACVSLLTVFSLIVFYSCNCRLCSTQIGLGVANNAMLTLSTAFVCAIFGIFIFLLIFVCNCC